MTEVVIDNGNITRELTSEAHRVRYAGDPQKVIQYGSEHNYTDALPPSKALRDEVFDDLLVEVMFCVGKDIVENGYAEVSIKRIEKESMKGNGIDPLLKRNITAVKATLDRRYNIECSEKPEKA